MSRIPLAILSLLLSVSPALSHDLWLQPEPDPSRPGGLIFRAVVGASFPKWEEAKKASDYPQVRTRASGPPILPLPDPEDPTLLGRAPGDAAFFVAAPGPVREIDLKPSEARGYLQEEVGLDGKTVETILKDAGPTLHETYSRTLRLLVIPSGSALSADTPFGFPLEILLLRLERREGPEAEIAFRLLRDGKPLPGAAVRLLSPGRKFPLLRTDSHGEATARVDAGKPILLAFIELVGTGKGSYETRWSNLAIFDERTHPGK
jgi:hypothetical protein